MHHLELRHLRLLVAVVETGSVTAAGSRLHLTQSALSHQLRDIESRLEVDLFQRIGKRMVLTPAGEELLASARQALDVVSRAEQGLKRHRETGRGRLRISTECYTCYHWLPGVLKAYRSAHPHVDIEIDVASTPHPVPHLLDGRLDLAIVTDPVRDRRIVELPLFHDDMMAITRPRHPMTAKKFVVPQDFAGETLIIYPPKEESTFYQRYLVPAGVRPAALLQVQLTEAIIELVKAGIGVAVLAKWAVEPHLRAGTIAARPVTRRGYRRKWSAAVLRDLAGRPYVKDFVALLAEVQPQMLPVAKRA